MSDRATEGWGTSTAESQRSEARAARLAGIAAQILGQDIVSGAWLRDASRSDVLRARLSDGQSVILKAAQAAPDASPRGPPAEFAAEAAALEILASVEGAPAPRLLGRSDDPPLLILEDLADPKDSGPAVETLESILAGPDRDAAVTALVRTAESLAALHALTVPEGLALRGDIGRRDERGRQDERGRPDERGRQGVTTPPDGVRPQKAVRDTQADQLIALLRPIRSILAAASVTEAPEFEDEVRAVAEIVRDPGDCLCLTHGDMAPSNVVMAGGRAVLVDFEYAALRHAGYDAAFWWCIVPLPPDIAGHVDAAYRRAMSWARTNPARWSREAAALTGHRFLWSLTWHTEAALVADKPWAPGLTVREAVLGYADGFIQAEAASGDWPGLRQTVADLRDALQDRWPGVVPGGRPFRALA